MSLVILKRIQLGGLVWNNHSVMSLRKILDHRHVYYISWQKLRENSNVKRAPFV